MSRRTGTAVIVVADPAHKHAQAMVSDDGTVTWERDYWPEAATITAKPDYSRETSEPGTLAAGITATLALHKPPITLTPLSAHLTGGRRTDNAE
jgi:hypothetical protein